MRGATAVYFTKRHRINVSIHAPHAGRDKNLVVYLLVVQVSIHAPHAGRDANDMLYYNCR